MNDDLISRKELLKKFIISDNGIRIPEYDIDNFPVEIPIKDVKDIIRQLPASFDKEKVIEELKANMNSFAGISGQAVTFMFSNGYYNGTKDAIEIVEKGGIE